MKKFLVFLALVLILAATSNFVWILLQTQSVKV